jgi:hypothetical protein
LRLATVHLQAVTLTFGLERQLQCRVELFLCKLEQAWQTINVAGHFRCKLRMEHYRIQEM